MRLRTITEDSDFFSYDSVAKELWNEKLSEARDEFDISFDTENDDDIVQRSITIEQSTWDHTKCTFKCEMRAAGGDWQDPIRYFRCQLSDGYADGLTKSGDSCFCFIPDKDGGNSNLVKTTSSSSRGWTAPDNEESEDIEPNERKCWDSLKTYLTGLVDKEVKNVQDGEI